MNLRLLNAQSFAVGILVMADCTVDEIVVFVFHSVCVVFMLFWFIFVAVVSHAVCVAVVADPRRQRVPYGSCRRRQFRQAESLVVPQSPVPPDAAFCCRHARRTEASDVRRRRWNCFFTDRWSSSYSLTSMTVNCGHSGDRLLVVIHFSDTWIRFTDYTAVLPYSLTTRFVCDSLMQTYAK